MPSRATTERINFGKIKEIIAPPNLIELQTNSYREFLQAEIPQSNRRKLGLQAVVTEVFPTESYDGKCVLDFHSYEIGGPKVDWLECLGEGLTYGAPLYVTFVLKEEKGTKEEKVFMGELPLMTPQGTFVINGAERVIVSQLHRSPGLAFEATQHPNGKTLHSFRIIPDRGSWYEAQFDTSDLLYVYLDRKKRRRKFLTTTFFRALSFLDSDQKTGKDATDKNRGTDEEILKLFYDVEEFSVKEAEKRDDLANKVLIEDALDQDKGLVVARAFEPLSKAVVKQIAELGINKIKVVDTTLDEGIVIKCMKQDPAKNEEEALKDIYRRLRPGDPPTAANARALIKRLFFDPKRYDLGRVGRYKINQKLGIKGGDSRILTKEDLVAATKYLLRLKKGEGSLDDIDHLGSRRVRTVGELLANQCRVGLARTERLVKERMTLFDQGMESMAPQKLINPKALSAVIRDFFGRSQLSQFMDQINPLAELTHKRRLSALGPGGLSRDRAGFEVRDVHPSHYGRICPVETPEGPNIGLIASLATFARVNDFGFLETPYRKAEKGRVISHIDYLTADREEKFIVAQANAPIDEKGHFTTARVPCRATGDFVDVEPQRVDYMDVSPKQLVSVAAGLIPFLEHDDANRALMGSNMQRQAVPLLVTEAPLVATGLEDRVARDSRAVIVAEDSGRVASVTGNQVIITSDGKLPESKRKIRHDPANGIHVYQVRKFMRSNAATCINQKILVEKGDHVKKGQVIADGPCTDGGELALGRNVLVAFMPWNGYNIEDAILISQRMPQDEGKKAAKQLQEEYKQKIEELRDQLTEALSNIVLGEKIPLDVVNSETGEIIIPANRKITKTLLRKLATVYDRIEIDPSPIRNKITEIIGQFKKRFDDLQMQYDEEVERAEAGEGVEAGIVKSVKVYIASKRKLSVGDKMAGRHGNKGVVAKIVKEEDMPHLADGTPVEIVLNPLGVPSRMNVGQVLETHLGWAAKLLGLKFATPVFDGIKEKDIRGYLKEAGFPENAKTKLIDGRSGEIFDQEIVVGYIYMMY